MSMLQGLAFNEVLSSVSEGRKQCDTAASPFQRPWKFTGVWDLGMLEPPLCAMTPEPGTGRMKNA